MNPTSQQPFTGSIGVPRSILHYEFAGLFERFLSTLGFKVVLSPETNREIFQLGKSCIPDEFCYPIKVFLGHVRKLVAMDVDRILIPTIVSHQSNRSFPCHPRSRLADLVRSLGLCSTSQLLAPPIHYDREGPTQECMIALAASLGRSVEEAVSALRHVTQAREDHSASLSTSPQPTLGVIGHPYVVEDRWASRGVLDRLRELGCSIITERELPSAAYAPDTTGLHFALAGRSVNLAMRFDQMDHVDGIVFLIPFNCGPDGDIAHHIERSAAKPFMTLVIDEQQADGGLDTRLEAFLDLLAARSTIAVGGAS